MIIPFLGYWGKRNAYYASCGNSANNGFKLTILGPKKEKLHFQTKNYEKEGLIIWSGNDFLDNLIFFAVFVVMFLLSRLLIPNSADMLTGIAFLVLSALLSIPTATIVIALFSIRSKRELREWHACEHKAAILVIAGVEISIENLKKCPMVVIECGSAWLIIGLEIAVSCVFLLSAGAILTEFTPAIFSMLVLFLSACALMLANIALKISSIFKFWLCPLLLPAAILPLLLERIFVLKNPSEEKLLQTVEELKQFFANLETPTS